MFEGKGALVTGSLDGIGFAIAKELAAKGCSVMLNGIGNEATVKARLATLREAGGTAQYHSADLSVPEQIKEMVDGTIAELGSLDIVVNNAVTRHYAHIDEYPVDRWNYALAVNLSAPFHIIRLAMPAMKTRKWGRIISLGSNYALAGTTRRADYCSTKHGLVGLTKVVALEGLPYGITANIICPGATYTSNTKKLIEERMAGGKSEQQAIRDYLDQRQPSKRFIPAEKIGQLVTFLCSDAASEMTGTPITMDGGWMAYS
jgi:3-hydroxybutyrate dehydrogenase